MTEFTQNYGMNKPDFNESIWHDEVNDNFDLIDAIFFGFTGLSNFVGTWTNSTNYLIGNRVFDDVAGTIWQCLVDYTSAGDGTFLGDRTVNPTYWIQVTSLPLVRGAWQNDTLYLNGEIAYHSAEGVFGRAAQQHTSLSAPNTMRDDAANWEFFFDLQAGLTADQIAFVPAGGIAATDVQAAVEEVEADAAAALVAEAATKVDLLDPAYFIPPGVVWEYAGASTPTGWLLCQGQAVSRTTYAALFTAIGTTYGVGDGSTTFNVPDDQGRVVAGKEASATRLTTAGGGIDGATLGAAGGDQRAQDHTHGPGNLTGTTNTTGAHTHEYWDKQRSGTHERGAGNIAVNLGEEDDGRTTGSAGDHSHTVALDAGVTNNPGGTKHGGDTGNVQPTIVRNKIIKT